MHILYIYSRHTNHWYVPFLFYLMWKPYCFKSLCIYIALQSSKFYYDKSFCFYSSNHHIVIALPFLPNFEAILTVSSLFSELLSCIVLVHKFKRFCCYFMIKVLNQKRRERSVQEISKTIISKGGTNN